MTQQTQPQQRVGQPIQSGPMYIGLCQTRAQAAALRWQYAVVFMALNGVIGGWCLQLLDPSKVQVIGSIGIISLVMLGTNFLFRGLVSRANQWIDYFTIAIEKIESESGTESGVLVFSDPNYLSKDVTQSSVQGFRFRRGIRTLSDSMIAIWGGIFIATLAWGMYVAGQGGIKPSTGDKSPIVYPKPSRGK